MTHESLALMKELTVARFLLAVGCAVALMLLGAMAVCFIALAFDDVDGIGESPDE